MVTWLMSCNCSLFRHYSFPLGLSTPRKCTCYPNFSLVYFFSILYRSVCCSCLCASPHPLIGVLALMHCSYPRIAFLPMCFSLLYSNPFYPPCTALVPFFFTFYLQMQLGSIDKKKTMSFYRLMHVQCTRLQNDMASPVIGFFFSPL